MVAGFAQHYYLKVGYFSDKLIDGNK